MNVAYADPPYPGLAKKHYADHEDYAGEVDHRELLADLCRFDAWVLHTGSVTLSYILGLCPPDVRVGAWVKTFAVLKPRVNPAYAWEPVIFYGGRNDPSREAPTVVDWIAHPITLRKGLTGAKPPAVIEWAFRMLGLNGEDALVDLFPGTGIVSRTWESFSRQLSIPDNTSARLC